MGTVAAEAQVLLVGGGPAGLATAIEARRRELDVLLVDRAVPPIDKPCGEGLMPDGVERLAALGVRLESGDGRPFRGIRYLDGERVAEAEFPRGAGLGLRRTVLHRALVRRAKETGVRLLWGVVARGLVPGGVETDQGRLRAEWIVGADGLHSRLRRWAGLEGRPRRWRRFGVRRHYALPPWGDRVEVHWGERCEAYVTPVSEHEVGVAFLWSGEKSSFGKLLEGFPALRARLRGAQASSRDRGAGPFDQRPTAVCREHLALVGDAAGYRDAITGEGLSLSLHQAGALAEALAAGDLRPYAAAVRRQTALPFALIRALLWADRHPELRRRLLATLAREPALFGSLLAVHARQLPLRSLGLRPAWRLVAGLARAAH
jgi:flavin-dependent dehydrogenase